MPQIVFAAFLFPTDFTDNTDFRPDRSEVIVTLISQILFSGKSYILFLIAVSLCTGHLSKTYPSFFTIKEGSTSHLGLLPSGKKRKTALRCSEPLRYKVGGASKPSPWLCGMGPPYYSLLWDRRAVARDGLKIYDQSPRHVVRDGTAWL